jgi:hypothetical protein
MTRTQQVLLTIAVSFLTTLALLGLSFLMTLVVMR